MNAQERGVAIVGAGNISRTHAESVNYVDGLRAVAVVDPITESAERLADTVAEQGNPRPAVYATLDDALSDPAVDVVAIGTPSGLHVAQAVAAMKAGKAVVIEKPLDTNVARAREALKVAEETGAVHTVISQHRFDPASQFVKKKIEEGKLGRITSAIATLSWYRSQAYYDSGDWRGTWAMDGGGALMNQGVHQLDLLIWMLGVPKTITAFTALAAHEGIEVEDTAVAVISFESGALALLHATTAAYPGLFARLQIMGSQGSAIIENDRLQYYREAVEGEDIGQFGVLGASPQTEAALAELGSMPTGAKDPTEDPGSHIRQYQDFAAGLDGGPAPLVSIAEAARSLATIRAVYISATLGEPVQFQDVWDGKYDGVAPLVGGAAAKEAGK